MATIISSAVASDLSIALAIDPQLRGVTGNGAKPIPANWFALCATGTPPAGCNSAYIAADASMFVSDVVQAGVGNTVLTAALGLNPAALASLVLKISLGTVASAAVVASADVGLE